MFGSVCFVVFCILKESCYSFSPVSLQDSAVTTVTRYSFVGGSVTLPCIYGNNLQGNDVYWRYNVSRKVLSIIKGKPSPEKQDKIFSNRTDSFPSEYPKGNYSVVLKDLELTHAGNYTCFLQNSDGEKNIQLFVKGTWNPCLKNYDFKLHTTGFYTTLINKSLNNQLQAKETHGNTVTEDFDFSNHSTHTLLLWTVWFRRLTESVLLAAKHHSYCIC
ncbi:V-set domain-containing T-cell activation inhibitor 1 [Labeo rohita]|uniref:V-set domain-containing T-cell activation inhibitor 1 n=1 Tax=Labeo rohita TaxID=84645 RepID=A0ABQ8L0R4_LABRO|nr:V-set domain-containing T-cell activation inhibitor 1 [Labeo rohita]